MEIGDAQLLRLAMGQSGLSKKACRRLSDPRRAAEPSVPPVVWAKLGGNGHITAKLAPQRVFKVEQMQAQAPQLSKLKKEFQKERNRIRELLKVPDDFEFSIVTMRDIVQRWFQLIPNELPWNVVLSATVGFLEKCPGMATFHGLVDWDHLEEFQVELAAAKREIVRPESVDLHTSGKRQRRSMSHVGNALDLLDQVLIANSADRLELADLRVFTRSIEKELDQLDISVPKESMFKGNLEEAYLIARDLDEGSSEKAHAILEKIKTALGELEAI